ncbi:MAG TPA: hypothetical protein VGD35_01440 [Chitinophaga sp.]
MKSITYLLLSLLAAMPAFSQEKDPYADSAAVYFNEIKAAAPRLQAIWNHPLDGPLLFVNPRTRQLYANLPDTALGLAGTGPVYTGALPKANNIANTAMQLGGHRWAMVLLPLPAGKQDRLNLLAHELFHRVQPALGFQGPNPDNNHLDEKDGRIYLRLELAALKAALRSAKWMDVQTNLCNALTFRKYRYHLYPGADTTENMLELNEGLAEYTGMTGSGRNEEEQLRHFESDMDRFLANPTFVRSFAYQTIPVYGYLLHRKYPLWNRKITIQTNLTDYFIKTFPVSMPADLEGRISALLKYYNADSIIAGETARAEQKKALIARYKQIFIVQPHLEISFVKMNVSFNPSNIQPLEDKGTVYPTIRVTDEWGILEAQQGALMSPKWDKITVSAPVKTAGQHISGEGWTITLNEGWTIVKDSLNEANYQVKKAIK